jgi:hypothetical protein
MAQVVIHGWKPGILVVSCVQALHYQTDLSLRSAKATMEAVLAGTTQTVSVPTASEAARLSETLVNLGALAHAASAA